jgi:ribosomal protein L22
MLYADFLLRRKRTNDALAQLDAVVNKAQDNPFTNYNAGLLYLRAQAFDKALIQAHRAMADGVPRTDLQESLRAAGKWRDPAPVAGAASAAASAP